MQTGPKTTMGKIISSLNSLTHGLNIVDGYLPCKQHRCYFINQCLLNILYGKDILLEIPYASPCPLEVAKYESMVCDDNIPPDIRHKFIMLSIRQDRQLKLSAMDADLTREVDGHRELAISCRYRKQIMHNMIKLVDNSYCQV